MKKTIQKMIALFLVIAVFLAAAPLTVSAASSGSCGNSLTWNFAGGVLTISGTGEMWDFSENIDEYGDDHTILRGWEDFADSITSVVVKSGVVSIGGSAFRNLRSLTDVQLPEGLDTIGMSAFESCTSLQSIAIPESVTVIDGNVFTNCSSLRSVSVPQDNSSYSSVDGVLFSKYGEYLITYPIGKPETSYEVPNGVFVIGYGAFESSANLQSVSFPYTLAEIQGNAFIFSPSLRSVTIPGNVEIIGSWAFSYCDSLKSITVKDTGLEQKIKYGAFAANPVLESVVIPPSVSEIGTSAFWNSPNAYIVGAEGSCAETYANENGIPFFTKIPTVPQAPVISVENALTGVKVSWAKVPAAYKYAVFRKGPGESGFTKIGTTSSLSYTDTTAQNNTEYRYTVKSVSSAGKASAYAAGQSIKYLKAPTIKAENALDGVKITWNKITGASKYYIYRKGPGETGFSLLASTTNLTFTNKGVVSGNDYRYSVRAYPATGKMSAFSVGYTVSYLKAPTITVKNTSEGVVISWAKITGASKYYVYRKGPGESGFTKIAGAVGLKLTDKTAVSGKEYRYSVRSVNSDATALSAFSAGQSIVCKR